MKKYKIRYSQQAGKSLRNIFDYISQYDRSSAVQVVSSISKSIDTLCILPHLGIAQGSIYKLVNSEYKYSIFYVIYPERQTVEILYINKYQNITF